MAKLVSSIPLQHAKKLFETLSITRKELPEATITPAGLLPNGGEKHPNAKARIGDLKLDSLCHYERTGKSSSITLECCCGLPQDTSEPSLHKWATTPGSLFYLPAKLMDPSKRVLSAKTAFEIERPTRWVSAYLSTWDAPYGYVCKHIAHVLKEAYPYLYDVWKKLRYTISLSVSRGNAVDYPSRWFRRDVGLLSFIEDIGLPDIEGLVLRKTGQRRVYRGENYTWLETPEGYDSGRGRMPRPNRSDRFPAQIRVILERRYYAIRARKDGVCHWKTVDEFLETVPAPPAEFALHSDQCKLRFHNPKELGFGVKNAKWYISPLLEVQSGTASLEFSLGNLIRGETCEQIIERTTFLLCSLQALSDPSKPKFVSGERNAQVFTFEHQGKVYSFPNVVEQIIEAARFYQSEGENDE